jgi:hypothetical protein
LESHRVINADRASSCDPLRAGTRCSSLDGWIHGDLFAVPLNDQRRPGQQLRSPAGRVGVPSGDQLRAVLQLQSPSGRYSMQFPGSMRQQMHNPGSHGQQLRTSANRSTPGRFAAAIPAGRYSMQFPRWMNPWASSCNPLRAGTRCSSLDPCAGMMHNPGSHGDLVGVRSSEALRAGLQLRSPAGLLEFDRVINADRASMMQSPAGRYSMQFPKWIPGPAVCTTLDPRASSCERRLIDRLRAGPA